MKLATTMTRFLALALAGLIASSCSAQTFVSFGAGNTGGGGGGACPNGSAYADGCAAAVPASDQKANFFTSYALQSGQTYATRPPWNVAWVDYATGIPTSQTLTDIAVSQPAHAACAGGWNASTRRLTCTSPTTNLTISGYDFTSGGTACSTVLINGTATPGITITFSNNKFAMSSTGSDCNAPATQLGITIPQGTQNINTVFTHNEVDAKGDLFQTAFRAGFISITSGGKADVTYNHFRHLASRAVTLNTGGNQNISFNSVDGMSYDFTNYPTASWNFNQHGEFGLHSTNGTTGQVAVNYSFNTIMFNSDNYGANTSNIAATQDAAASFASYTADHNTLVANMLANWRSSNGVTVASGGTGWGAPNIGDILQVNDGCATNSVIQVSQVAGAAVTAVDPLLSGRCASQPTGTKTTTCLSGTCLSSGTGLTIAALYSNSTGGYVLTAGTGTYASGFFAATANYFDPSGAGGCVSTQGSGITISYSGNLNLRDSSSISDEVLANCHGHN